MARPERTFPPIHSGEILLLRTTSTMRSERDLTPDLPPRSRVRWSSFASDEATVEQFSQKGFAEISFAIHRGLIDATRVLREPCTMLRN
jgi:hypothetical protein